MERRWEDGPSGHGFDLSPAFGLVAGPAGDAQFIWGLGTCGLLEDVPLPSGQGCWEVDWPFSP